MRRPQHTKARRTDPKYRLFEAAKAGCLQHVRQYIEIDHVDPASVSDQNQYTVKDFADYAVQQGVPGALEVQAYLISNFFPLSILH